MLTRTTGRSRSRRMLAVVAAASMIFAACSNADDDDDAGTADATEDTADEATEDTADEATEEPSEDTADEATADEATEDTADEATEDTADEATEEPSEDTADEATEDTADESSEDTADESSTEEPADDPTQPELGEFAPIEGVPGVTDEEIGFAVLGTGPSNPLGYCLLECYANGVQAYFDWRNSVGGVNGRDLVINRIEDDEIANNQVLSLELSAADDVFGIFAAPLIYAGFPDLASSGVPTYTVFPASPEANGFENIYIPGGTQCLNCPRKQTVLGAQLAGGTKVGSLGFSTSQASIDCVANHGVAFDQWGTDLGIEQVYSNAELAFGLPNGLGPEVTAMIEAGVDYVVTCIDQNSALSLAQELQRQGSDAKIILPQGYGDSEFLSGNADVLEGDLLSPVYRPMEADNEGTLADTMYEWIIDGGYQLNDYAIQGWLGADMAVTGLVAAGAEFDQASVIAAMNEITDYTAGGIMPPVDWTRQHNAPTPDDRTNAPAVECGVYLTIVGGSTELMGDPVDPFYCVDPNTPEWEEPTQMSFS